MAAPMREGAPAGGPRPAPHHHPANFEYDDNEWDIGIGDLIIDLDADIEKTDEAGGMAARAEPDAQRTALKMKIKRTKPGTKSSEAKHEIVKSNEMNGEPKGTALAAPPAAAKRGSGGHRRDKARDKHHHPHPHAPHAPHASHAPHPPHDVNGVARVPPPPNAPGPPVTAPAPPPSAPSAADTRPAPAPRSDVKLNAPPPAPAPAPLPPPAPAPHTAPATPKPEPDDSRQDSHSAQPPAKKLKMEPKETAEVCVGTSVGTITEPDCLGPCEPGTSVTLEGIVWHETEGGVLVVNVTWRGKTYVGTLLDCTRHDWAPPRFCDSPTEELDARTPKGRAKRGRGAAPTDMTNFTETRSSVHSKLRNGGAKGRRALPSPTPFTPPRPDSKRKRTSEAEERPPTPKAKRPPPTPTSPPPDPVLLECPEPNCSKKYKHANGLKYHRSHAHGTPDDDLDKDGSSSEQEEPAVEPVSPVRPPSAPATPATPVKSPTPAKSPEIKEKSPEKSPEKPETSVDSPIQQRFPEEFPETAESAPQPERTPTPPASATPPPEALPTLQPTQFKVKPRSALMPTEERKSTESPPDESPGKRRARRSPTPGVRSPAYSDISDDAAPTEGAPDPEGHRPFPVYHQYYGQPPYLPPAHATTAPPPTDKGKDDHKGDPKADLKDVKPEGGPPKVLPQHFYPYNYVPNFPYNVEGGPPGPPLDDKNKETDRSKTTPSPLDKSKQRLPDGKENPARPNDNHQILKESIEMKAQMGPYAFQRPPHAREEELRRYYMTLEQRRKEGERPLGGPVGPGVGAAGGAGAAAGGGRPPPQPAHKPPTTKDSKDDKPKDEPKVKQEGQKPTTETQGPPPPPTSQYYLPPYMQAPHYGALPFDPVYRAPLSPMLVGGFGGGWTVPRYHAPEDLSRPGAPAKLDLLPPGHGAQYAYGGGHGGPHKIHELQEHAKSPQGKPAPRGDRDQPKDAPARSPPPQRHVHTHHHTHVGLGYPLYPPPYPGAR
ncbi:zinc finger protein 608-like isoform X2 [Hyposmocoma kahamanoa]|uniref:zinc finger protein 608-like isoform X2 n=1 Tax=Hyposmocoma kahamanoa TaxID=1477025 RepID=UPI000E6D7F06|nr:zinc finger protein 608-like isoform X2 [Hyposmocoma kahamanoa]